MKLMVATKETQGQRENDFNFCDENEIVTFASECSRESVDGHCGCRRSMSGVNSLKATTTMRVIEHPYNAEALEVALYNSLGKAGWLKYMDKAEADRLVKNNIKDLIELANKFKVNDIIERREKFQVRKAKKVKKS